jgi:hypothetical protein
MPNGKPGPLRHKNTQRIHFFKSSNKTLRHSPSRDVAFFNVGTPYYPMRTIPTLRKTRKTKVHVMPTVPPTSEYVFNPLRKLIKHRPRTRKHLRTN